MRVYFVRHGRTHGNTSAVHQDHTDELNEIGLEQAKKVAQRFRTIDVDVILSSDYIRALVTAEEIAKLKDKKVEVVDLLRERKRPSSLVGKRYDSDEVLKVIQQLEEKKNNPDFRYEDEENHHDALKRAQKLLQFLEKRKEKEILAVTHAAYMRFILTALIFGNEATVEQFTKIYDTFRLNNTGITVCEYSESMRGMYKKDTYWRVVTWNDHSHLGEAPTSTW